MTCLMTAIECPVVANKITERFLKNVNVNQQPHFTLLMLEEIEKAYENKGFCLNDLKPEIERVRSKAREVF